MTPPTMIFRLSCIFFVAALASTAVCAQETGLTNRATELKADRQSGESFAREAKLAAARVDYVDSDDAPGANRGRR